MCVRDFDFPGCLGGERERDLSWFGVLDRLVVLSLFTNSPFSHYSPICLPIFNIRINFQSFTRFLSFNVNFQSFIEYILI